jgi:hypothetical protein
MNSRPEGNGVQPPRFIQSLRPRALALAMVGQEMYRYTDDIDISAMLRYIGDI